MDQHSGSSKPHGLLFIITAKSKLLSSKGLRGPDEKPVDFRPQGPNYET